MSVEMLKTKIVFIIFLVILYGCDKDHNSERMKLANTQIKQGEAKITAGDYVGAKNDFTKAIQYWPTNSLAYVKRGMCKFFLTDYTGAISDFNEAIKIHEIAELDVSLIRGYAQMELKNYTEAMKDMNAAILSGRNRSAPYIGRSKLKIELQDYRGAIADLDKAIEKEPNNSEAYSLRGWAKNRLKDYENSLMDLNKAIKLNPNEAEAYYYRGYTKFHLEKSIEGACLDWSKAGELGYLSAYESIQRYCH